MIKILVMDVDGTLTDGKIYIGQKGEVMKAFHVKDGYAISHLLRENLIEPIVLTGRKSEIINVRCAELQIRTVMQNIQNKYEALNEYLKANELSFAQAAYIGDDLPDMECMSVIQKVGGLTGCPADAVQKIRNVSSYVCRQKGGDGAVREFIEWILKTECNHGNLV